MIRNVMEGMGAHLLAYPLVSLVLFVTFFAGVILWACLLSRPHVEHMSQLPLDPANGDDRHA